MECQQLVGKHHARRVLGTQAVYPHATALDQQARLVRLKLGCGADGV